jgi:RimJ/RimL family protein N-acetyltransferase
MDPHRMPAEIHTARLVVRLAREEDGAAVADAIEETLDLLVPWFKWAELLDSWGERGDFEGRALTAVRRFEEGEGPTYYLWAADRLVGEVWLGAEGSRFDVLNYNVWVRRGAVGAGYGAEGSRAVLSAAFTAGFDAVEALVRSGNPHSRRLLTAIGFQRHGWSRQLERFVIDHETLIPAARGPTPGCQEGVP